MSPVAISSWTIELAPSKKYQIEIPADLHVTNASLGEQLADEKGRSVIKVTIHEPVVGDSDDEEEEDEGDAPTRKVDSVLGSLRAGTVEQMTLDVIFLQSQTIEFEVTGKNTVYLLGNYIDQEGGDDDDDGAPFDESDLDDEEAFRLQDVSSDVEMDAADLAGLGDDDSDDDDAARFEELPAEKPASSKKQDSKKRDAGAAGLKDGGKEGKKAKGGDKPANKKPESKPAPSEKPKSDGGNKPKQDGGKPKSLGGGAGGDKPKSKGGDQQHKKPKSKGGKK